MKKKLTGILMIIFIVVTCVACGAKTCHYCGEKISGDPLKKDGRYYCDYDCYLCEIAGF